MILPGRSGQRPPVLPMAIFALAFILGAELGHGLSFPGSSVATFWPPSGIYLAALLLTRRSHWPWLVLTGLAANLLSDILWHNHRLAVSSGFSTANAVEAIAGALLVTRAVGTPITLGRLREVFALIGLGAFAAPGLGATIGSLVVGAHFGRPFGAAWLSWWSGDALGVILVSPAVVSLAHLRRVEWAPRRIVEGALLAVALSGVGVFIFTHSADSLGSRPYPLFPFLLWTAARFGLRGTTLAILLVAGPAVALTAHGYGPFATTAGSPEFRLVTLQLSMATLSLSFLTLAAGLGERERTATALREARAFAEKVLDTTPGLIHVYDLVEQRNVFLSASFAAALGFTPDELQGDAWVTIRERIHPDDVGRVASQLNGLATAKDGEVHALEFRLRARDGRWRWFHERQTILSRLPDGRPHQFLSSGVDITERKATEEAVQAAERRFRRLATMAPVGIIQTDAQGRCLFVNDQWCRLSGLSAEASLGDGWRTALHPEDRARIDAAWEEAVRTGQEFAADHRFLRPSGEVCWASGRAVALHDAHGQVTGYLASVMDITERYQAEKQIRAALHEKETLLKEVHHRVKNNMAVIASLLGMQASRATDSEAASILQECRNRVHAMAAIHEELYQSGDLAHIDLGPYVQRLCAELERSSGGPAGRVHARVCVPPLPVDLETAVPLGLIVNELVTNAFKHAFPAGRGGEVVVRLAAEADDRVTLTVQDDGVGLPAGLDPGRARSLGLRLVHSLARQLRAQVALENGTGTTVRLTFPLPGPRREET